MNDLNGIADDLIEKHIRISNFIDEFFKYLTNNQISLLEAYDIIGKITQHDPDRFIEKIYPKLYPKINEYFVKNFGDIAVEKRYEMDEHILKNYCFFKDEEITTKFTGNTFINSLNLFGFIYVTTHRIINVGAPIKGFLNLLKSFHSPVLGLIDNALLPSRTKGILDKISEDQEQKSNNLNLGQWGYIIPVRGSHDVKNKFRQIVYNLKVKEYTMTGPYMERDKIYKITISVSKLKSQSKQEFIDYSQAKLDQINQLLDKYM